MFLGVLFLGRAAVWLKLPVSTVLRKPKASGFADFMLLVVCLEL
jgi:hypothetical protein